MVATVCCLLDVSRWIGGGLREGAVDCVADLGKKSKQAGAVAPAAHHFSA
jgi:hypothetical protein